VQAWLNSHRIKYYAFLDIDGQSETGYGAYIADSWFGDGGQIEIHFDFDRYGRLTRTVIRRIARGW